MNANTTITLTGKLLRGSLCTLLALTCACGAQSVGTPGGDDDPGTPDPGNPDPGDPTAPLDVTGSYQIDSSFDMVGGMPGTVGDVVNGFIDMTDDPYDPATWVLDQVVAHIDNSFIRGLINGARPVLDGMLYQVIEDRAPELVNQLIQIGDQFGQVSQHFGTLSTLQVQGSGESMVATHTVTGYQFDIDGTHYEYDLAELGSDPAPVTGVSVSLDGETSLTLAQHNMPLQYGGFLALALDDVIIPAIDPNAANLDDLLNNLVPCDDIGAALSDQLGFGSPDFYSGLCQIGLQQGSNFLMDKLISLDEQARVTLVISGQAHIADKNSDRKIDTLSAGKWNGTIDYLGNSGDMGQDASTFSGARM